MTSSQKLGIASLGFIALLAVVIGRVMAHIDPSPLRVGATADEAWTYIHTNSPSLAPSGTASTVEARGSWRADARSIEHETRLYWRTNHLFATRKILYIVDTNSTITAVHSHWKFTWPF